MRMPMLTDRVEINKVANLEVGHGVTAQNVCDIACEVARQACYASPVPNFLCDIAANACHSAC